jgi:chemotaxis methyl-accepting protein methylase
MTDAALVAFLVLCRNMLLTYIEESLHVPLLEQLVARLLPGGALVVGSRESMPPMASLPSLQFRAPGVYIAADSAGR